MPSLPQSAYAVETLMVDVLAAVVRLRGGNFGAPVVIARIRGGDRDVLVAVARLFGGGGSAPSLAKSGFAVETLMPSLL